MSNTRSILAFSALLALASEQARASLASPAGPSPTRDLLAAADHSNGVRPSNPAPARPAAAPAPRAEAPGLPVKPAQRPAHIAEPPAEDEEAPAKEEKSDCDDCVIVDRSGRENPESGHLAGAGNLLAGTLWGLFAVSRPRRVPRAIIRGVTVP